MHMYRAASNEKEAMNVEEMKEEFIGGLEGGKEMGKLSKYYKYYKYYNLKGKRNNKKHITKNVDRPSSG